MRAAGDHRRIEVMRARHDVGDDFRVGRIGHRRLEDADDGRGARPEADGSADYRGIAVERADPEAMCEHRHARRVGPSSAALTNGLGLTEARHAHATARPT